MKSKIHKFLGTKSATNKGVLSLIALIASLSFMQAQSIKGNADFNGAKIENVKVEVEIDSAKELDATFTVDDFKRLLDETEDGEEVVFKIKCNGKRMSNGVKSSMSYEIKGNTNNKKDFLKRVAKVRKAAIKYYKSKK